MWEIAAKIFLSLNLLTLPVNYLPTIKYSENNQPAVTLEQQLVEADRLPHKKDNNSFGVKINSPAAAVMDKATGAILWQKNAEEVRSIASITKLMTALIFLEHNPGWQTKVILEQQDEANGDTPEILRGEEVTVKNLFYTALIASDNNAAYALVRSTGLSKEDFVKEMNNKAGELKLLNAKFVSPTGLEKDNQATAKEVLALAKVALTNSDIQAAVSLPEYTFTAVSGREHRVFSTNKLFGSYLQIIGGKTGYIEESGYCLVSEVANADDDRIITVVLGADSNDGRFQDLKILTTWILNNFSWS